LDGPVSFVTVTEIVPDRVPSIVKGTRTVAMLPKSVLLAYQVLKRGCTWNVTVDPDAEHDDRFPQLRRIGGDALNWNDRVFTLRLGENIVNAATNPVAVFSVAMVLILGATAETDAVVEVD